MKRLFFLNRYFHPDHSATSQLVSDLAFHLAASGRQVNVITSQQRYDDPAGHKRKPEHSDWRSAQLCELSQRAPPPRAELSIRGLSLDRAYLRHAHWKRIRGLK